MVKQYTDNEIAAAENIFREYLRGRGLKFTPERRTLLKEVLSNTEHFEAEQLLINLRQSGERVAKATIYRTLPLLVNCGILKAVQFGDKLTRYENTYGRNPHDHMVCFRCHRIIEFSSDEISRLRSTLAARYQFHALSHRFQITGLCQECIQSCPVGRQPFVPDTNTEDSASSQAKLPRSASDRKR